MYDEPFEVGEILVCVPYGTILISGKYVIKAVSHAGQIVDLIAVYERVDAGLYRVFAYYVMNFVGRPLRAEVVKYEVFAEGAPVLSDCVPVGVDSQNFRHGEVSS